MKNANGTHCIEYMYSILLTVSIFQQNTPQNIYICGVNINSRCLWSKGYNSVIFM